MSNKPTHIAYVITEPKEGDERSPFWRAVGAVWPHKSGGGFDVVIGDQISVTGRIVCTERKDAPESTAPAA
jgi:hypothetical protein